MAKDQDVVLSTALTAVAYIAVMFATKVAAVFLFNALPIAESYALAMDAGTEMDMTLFLLWFAGGGVISLLHFKYGWKMLWFVIAWTMFIQVVETFILR